MIRRLVPLMLAALVLVPPAAGAADERTCQVPDDLTYTDGTLPRVVESRRYDLLLLGAVTHRDGMTGWNESLSSRLVDATGGDVLLVKPEERRAGNLCPMDRLLRQQGAHLSEQLV